jgi:bifunctional non-homologous end joining protein LigD
MPLSAVGYTAPVPARIKASFIEPMLLLRQDALPHDPTRWLYQLKLDGYRSIAFKTGGVLHLRSRNNKDFSRTYAAVFKALAKLPNETVIDGEIVAVDDDGRPSFQLLQNAAAGTVPILYFVFDVMILGGRNVMSEPLEARLDLLERKVLPTLVEPVRYVDALDAELPVLIQSVREQRFEGLVAKRRDSRYEPGRRSGAWQKMRVNQGQEFVIGGYTIASSTFDALIVGYYDGDRLLYAARTRNGFTPAVRQKLFAMLRRLEIAECPFANLPEARGGRWGEGLTAAKMLKCRWVRPVLVGQFEFVEWTAEQHLRHTRFVGLREDKPAKSVHREIASGARS